MRSSYAENRYDEILGALTRLYKPKRIAEIGLLDGFSLKAFADAAPDAEILGFDIFADHVGKHPDEAQLREQFKAYKNVRIAYGDFYKLQHYLEGSTFDFIHVDVSNHAGVYEHAFRHYLPLLNEGGLLLLEGGTAERDQVEWMSKYGMKPIRPFLRSSSRPEYFTFDPFPGLTVVRK